MLVLKAPQVAGNRLTTATRRRYVTRFIFEPLHIVRVLNILDLHVLLFAGPSVTGISPSFCVITLWFGPP